MFWSLMFAGDIQKLGLLWNRRKIKFHKVKCICIQKHIRRYYSKISHFFITKSSLFTWVSKSIQKFFYTGSWILWTGKKYTYGNLKRIRQSQIWKKEAFSRSLFWWIKFNKLWIVHWQKKTSKIHGKSYPIMEIFHRLKVPWRSFQYQYLDDC